MRDQGASDNSHPMSLALSACRWGAGERLQRIVTNTMEWHKNIAAIHSLLGDLSIRDDFSQEIDQDTGFEKWLNISLAARNAQKTVFLIGNGASASMASHMAADLTKNGRLRTEVFYDLSLITALGNDIGFTEIFAEPLSIKMSQGDLLVAISSSGESPNIIKGVQAAIELGGDVVTLSAMNPKNRLRSLGKLNFYVSAETYGHAETCHAAILHYWMDFLAENTPEIA